MFYHVCWYTKKQLTVNDGYFIHASKNLPLLPKQFSKKLSRTCSWEASSVLIESCTVMGRRQWKWTQLNGRLLSVSHSVNNRGQHVLPDQPRECGRGTSARCCLCTLVTLRSYRVPQIRRHGRNDTEGTARETYRQWNAKVSGRKKDLSARQHMLSVPHIYISLVRQSVCHTGGSWKNGWS